MNPVQILEEEAIQPIFPATVQGIVLDLGCGWGRLSQRAEQKGARLTVGLDQCPQMLQNAKKQGSTRSHWVEGEALSLPFLPQSFDLVMTGLMMGHVENLGLALKAIDRILRPNGLLLITDFHPFAVLRGWKRTSTASRSGRTFEIRQHLHLFSDYMRHFRERDFVLEALEERLYKGVPVVFAMRIRKGPGSGTGRTSKLGG